MRRAGRRPLSRHPLVAWSSGDSATCAHASVRAAVVPLPHQHRLHRGRRMWRPRARPSATNGPCVRVHSTPTELRSLVVAPPALVEVTQCSTTMQYKHAEGAAVISPRMVPSTSGGAGAGVGSGAVQVQKTSDWCALPSMLGACTSTTVAKRDTGDFKVEVGRFCWFGFPGLAVLHTPPPLVHTHPHTLWHMHPASKQVLCPTVCRTAWHAHKAPAARCIKLERPPARNEAASRCLRLTLKSARRNGWQRLPVPVVPLPAAEVASVAAHLPSPNFRLRPQQSRRGHCQCQRQI